MQKLGPALRGKKTVRTCRETERERVRSGGGLRDNLISWRDGGQD